MSKAQNQTPVLYSATYRMWHRDCFDMERCMTVDKTFTGATEEEILMKVKYDMGHYGAIKAERQGDLNEITNRKN